MSTPNWTETPVGQRLLLDTRAPLNSLVRRFNGDTLVWSGAHSPSAEAMQRSMVRSRIYYSSVPGPIVDHITNLQGVLERQPLPTHSVEGFVLHHALEQAQDPRAALREVTRVLQPGGRLVLAGFNPWSVLGLRRLYAKARSDAFSGIRFINPIRLLDWLAVLGYRLESPIRYVSSGLPLGRWQRSASTLAIPRSTDRNGSGISIPLADVFMLEAVKQAYFVRPRAITPVLRSRKFGAVAYPQVVPFERGERDRP